MYSNELYHHGVLGMKWGVKNGPPYPLSDSKHSASEKKAGWRKSLDGSSKPTKKKKKAKKNEVSKSRAVSALKQKLEEKLNDKKKIEDRQSMIKNRRSLTDADIDQMIKRLQNEKRLKDLAEQDINPGKYAVKKILADAGMDVGKTLASAIGKSAIRKVAGDRVTGKEFAAYFKPKKN